MFSHKITNTDTGVKKVYYNLLQDYRKFERIANNYVEGSTELNLSDERFIAATTMIPLHCFAVKKNIKTFLVNSNTQEYVRRILNRKETSTTTPFQILPFSAKQRQDEELSLKITQKINPIYGGSYTL